MKRIIWQYWETRGAKPRFVDGLHQIACRNSGCEVRQVTPETLFRYLPDLPPKVLKIKELAHKADMIRAMLVERHGGMWLDSDAIVLRDLKWMFDLLDSVEFVGFNNEARLEQSRPWMRVNCFASVPNGQIITEWVRQQHAKLPRTRFGWDEIGTELLHPICLSRPGLIKVLPFELICPVAWNEVEKFMGSFVADKILADCSIVMLSNASLKRKAPELRAMSCDQIATQDTLVGAVMREALRGQSVHEPSTSNSLGHPLRSALQHLFNTSWK